ncbi:esterase/lipase family protein [Caenimonas aquaedulcis]|uniref:Alpha/beta hydrolase n=1 Tax=Caenimonas aquaedulcis TaxID=2793270 RepID=A0A931H381_9BURK|nr:alpha/beta hydrolase [Caenimonas aquaedulcis]MBG9387727.1 alpha/beta hydrolase [Caenimonas aquaedulcis]
MPQAQTLTSFSAPSLSLLATEPLRALFDFVSAKVGSRAVPIGDGHPVIVYPGLGGGALSTQHLRRFLADSGFEAHDWGGGLNTGPEGHIDDWLAGLEQRVRALHAQTGRTVSLVGWSLGGVYARELSRRCPECVRQVVTLGTPFASLGGGTHAGTVYKLLNRDTSQLTPQLEARLRQTPPVPTTSVYSKSDGIVSWRGCIEKNTARSESVEVHASHLGMGTHGEVLRIVADRLAQPEGGWKPIRRPSAPARSTRSRAR